MWSDKEAESRDVLQVTPHLTLTVNPHVTLKMTAAEAIETSVTTINSLSQDFTNLDDQPSRLLYMSSVRLRFIHRTNDKLIRCDNCSSFNGGKRP